MPSKLRQKKKTLIRIFQKHSLFFTILPAVLWFLGVKSRSLLISTYCLSSPSLCSMREIPEFDRLAFGMESQFADQASYFTQNLSGLLALLIPVFYHMSLAFLKGRNSSHVIKALRVDLTIIIQAMLWNGLLSELAHLLIRRPRPFVYVDPLSRGAEAAHYISFYSGHTSFAATSLCALFLTLYYRPIASWCLILCAVGGECLIFLTAYFRIFAGRHFLSDVLVGMIAGQLTAFAISYLNRQEVAYG